MRYTVEYTSKALKSLKKLDKPVLLMIKSWIEKNLIGTTEPDSGCTELEIIE